MSTRQEDSILDAVAAFGRTIGQAGSSVLAADPTQRQPTSAEKQSNDWKSPGEALAWTVMTMAALFLAIRWLVK